MTETEQHQRQSQGINDEVNRRLTVERQEHIQHTWDQADAPALEHNIDDELEEDDQDVHISTLRKGATRVARRKFQIQEW